ncbi:MAG: hypothetical protein R6V58_00070 [Planctomycetota bacterium]
MATTLWTGDAGDNDWSTAGNWSNGVPANGDTVYFRDGSEDVTASLDQSAVTVTKLVIEQSYTGLIGTPSAYLQIGATTVHIGEHQGYGTPVGSGRLKLDLDSAATMVTVYNTAATPEEENLPPVRLLVDTVGSVDSTVDVLKGRVGIAVEPDESSTITLSVGFRDSQSGDAEVVTGPGCTVDTLKTAGGDTECRAAPTTVTMDGGEVALFGTGQVTTFTIEGGTCYPENTGGIAAANFNGGESDFTRSLAARVVTAANAKPGATIKWDPDVVTMPQLTMTDPVSVSISEGL